jgi:Ribosomal protein L11 methyltransferase (PrmA)
MTNQHAGILNSHKIMFNDSIRNNFYKKILTGCIANKNCLEVGFGTGILSVIACDLGAKHVIAYEHNRDAYNFGQDLITTLKLSDRILLFNETFEPSKLSQHHKIDVMFSETVDNGLWGEGWYLNTFIDDPSINILPEKYFFESFCIEVENNYAQGLLMGPEHLCNPGININHQFVEFVNRHLTSNFNKDTLVSKINEYHTNEIVDISLANQGTFWGWHTQLMEAFDIRQKVADFQYVLDLNKKNITLTDKYKTTIKTINPDLSSIEFQLKMENPNSNYLMFFRVGLESNHEKFYLDSGHFGPFTSAFLLRSSSRNKIVNLSHNLFDGGITAEYNKKIIKKVASDNWA